MPKKCKISVIPGDKNLPHHKQFLFLQGIPADTKFAFKSACARQETTMRDAVIVLMRRYVAENK